MKEKELPVGSNRWAGSFADNLSGYDKLNNEDLMKLIRKLPDGYRAVINLNLVEGYNHKEMGEVRTFRRRKPFLVYRAE